MAEKTVHEIYMREEMEKASKRKVPRKDYRKEWGHKIEKTVGVMAGFDPVGARNITATANRMSWEIIGGLKQECWERYKPVLEGYGIDIDHTTRKAVEKNVPEKVRAPIFEEIDAIQAKERVLLKTEEAVYTPLRSLSIRMGKLLEGARTLYKEAVSDPNYHDRYTIEGMGDFCTFLEGIRDSITDMETSKGHVEPSVSMLVNRNAYNKKYSLNGVPDHEKFGNMIEACDAMIKTACRDKITHSY